MSSDAIVLTASVVTAVDRTHAAVARACGWASTRIDPARTLPALKRSAGNAVSVISAYLTAGGTIPASLITAANSDDAELLLTWEPDDGSDGADQPAHRLSMVTGGKYDASLRALVSQLGQVHSGAILRPMPEMNTPWFAWSGTVNHNSSRRVPAGLETRPAGG